MPSPILFVSSSDQHSNQIQIILEFLGYAVTPCTIDNLENQDALQNFCAIFVEHVSKSETTITRLRKQGLQQPIVLIVDQSAEHRLDNTTFSDNTSAVISWPLSQIELGNTLQSLVVFQCDIA